MARISNITALGVATTSSPTLATVPVSVQIVQAVCAERQSSSSMFQPLLLLCRYAARGPTAGCDLSCMSRWTQLPFFVVGRDFYNMLWHCHGTETQHHGAIEGSHHGHHHSLRTSCVRRREEKELGVQLMRCLSFKHQGWHFSWFHRRTLILGGVGWNTNRSSTTVPALSIAEAATLPRDGGAVPSASKGSVSPLIAIGNTNTVKRNRSPEPFPVIMGPTWASTMATTSSRTSSVKGWMEL